MRKLNVRALSVVLVFCAAIFAGFFAQPAKAGDNETMMQYFEWYLSNDGSFWKTTGNRAKELSSAGITSLWLPPAYKGMSGTYDVGYGPYDLYDLGEFNQMGTTRTKYGTKDEYLAAIKNLHANGIKVYADTVLNHKAGADSTESVKADKVSGGNRNNVVTSNMSIVSWTRFTFKGRNGKYSTFTWDASCFDGVDYDNKSKSNAIYRFSGKSWDTPVDNENGNYDYLMYADVDMDSSKVVNELKSWGKWYVNFADLDGFRLDAVKHIKYTFFKDWLTSVRNTTGKDLFAVGEYYSGDIGKLTSYLNTTGHTMSLFDFPLHYHFEAVSKQNGNYNMANLFKGTLVEREPEYAVTFVENHDTQPGQSTSTVGESFKVQAYTAILTRNTGYPCVFYGDYYGTNNSNASANIASHKVMIDRLLKARKDYAYGTGHDYLNGADIIGWTLEGDSAHADSGLAAIITDKSAGSLNMYVGKKHAGETWYDITGNNSGTVKIDSNGNGNFSVRESSASVWVKAPAGLSTNNKVVIYYKYPSANTNGTYIHYQIGSQGWTTAPGKKMYNDIQGGYDELTINLGSDTLLTCCFNNGSGKWDNNHESNYVLEPGIYTIDNGEIVKGVPKGKTILGNVTGFTSTDRTNTSVTLKWNKTANAEKYIVYQINNDTKKVIKSFTTTATSYKISGLGTAKKYSFVVKCFRTYRGKQYKGTSPIYVTYTAPNMARNLKVTAKNKTSVTIKWDAAAGANGYRIYQYDTAKKGYVKVAEVTGTTYKYTGLKAGTSYKFAVKAYKKVGTVYYLQAIYSLLTASTTK